MSRFDDYIRNRCILDRYLLWLYFKTLLVCLFGLFGLFVVSDMFNNLDEFLSYGKRYAGGTAMVLVEYYTPRLLQLFDQTAGLLAMAAAAFALTWLQSTNELTALLAAGISPARTLRPLLIASLAVALIGVANREFGLPQVRNQLARNAQDWLGEAGRKCTPRYDLRTDILISGKSTYAKDQRIAEPMFRLPPAFAAWGRQIIAENAFYRPAEGNKPAGYFLKRVKLPADLAKLPSLALDGKTVLFSPVDTPWLSPGECFVASVVTFEQLAAGGSWRQYLSSYELITGLRGGTIEPGADVRVALHARVVQPLLDLSLVLLGIPLVLSRARRNIFWAGLIGGGLVAAMMLVELTCHALGASYILKSATLAAWLPLLIFGPIAYASARPLWD
jgi:lipopolysaccharide export system permease protein